MRSSGRILTNHRNLLEFETDGRKFSLAWCSDEHLPNNLLSDILFQFKPTKLLIFETLHLSNICSLQITQLFGYLSS